MAVLERSGLSVAIDFAVLDTSSQSAKCVCKRAAGVKVLPSTSSWGRKGLYVDSPSGQEGLGGSQVRHGFEDVVGPLSQNFPFWES